MEITLSRKQHICKSGKIYFSRKICIGKRITTLQPGNKITVYIFPEDFDKKDLLKYKKLSFAEFTIHNLGDVEFYVQMILGEENSAPINLILPDLATELTSITSNGPKTGTTLIIILTVCCSGVVVIVIIVVARWWIIKSRNSQRRFFENPVSHIEFALWPEMVANYINAVPRERNPMEGEEQRSRSSNISNESGNLVFADYNDPSLGIGASKSIQEDNEYENYYESEEDQNVIECENIKKHINEKDEDQNAFKNKEKLIKSTSVDTLDKIHKGYVNRKKKRATHSI